jgi:urease subunit alpha
MKAWRASEAGTGHPGLPDDGAEDDNGRVMRYLAKVTLEPAIVHGVSTHVGSLTPGRLADIILWKPAYFGVKPELVLKAGFAAWAPLGEGNASVESAEPTRYAAHWGAMANAAASLSLTFVSGAVDADALAHRLGTRRRIVPVRRCRGLTRADLRWNRAMAPIEIDPGDGRVSLAGRLLAVEPATDLPLNRRYFLR